MTEEEAAAGVLAPGPVARTGDELAGVKAVEGPRIAPADASYGGVDSGGGGDNGDGVDNGAAPAGAAEENEFGEFAWPEGYAADPGAMAKFLPLAKEMGLGKEKAQRLATLYAEIDQERRRTEAAFVAKNNAEWIREIRSHPEFGGNALAATAERVAAAMRRFGTPLLTAQVRRMNIQNWPEMFFFLARVSQAVSEDCSPSGNAPAAPEKSAAQILFPGLG